MTMHSTFPVVSGRHSLDGLWTLELPVEFRRRVREGTLVLWRRGITIWCDKWGNENDVPVRDRIAAADAGRPADAFDVESAQSRGVGRLSYRRTETRRDATVHALYAFGFFDGGHIELAIYSASLAKLETARAIADSLRRRPGLGLYR
jgi:hypothetical protein